MLLAEQNKYLFDRVHETAYSRLTRSVVNCISIQPNCIPCSMLSITSSISSSVNEGTCRTCDDV